MGFNAITGTGNTAIAPAVIGTSSVTNAMLAQMAAHTLKGNATAGTANPTDLDGAASEQLLLFTQTGTGAVQRSLDSKVKDWVSVKDFGAVGNGVTDDTTAFQAALAAMTAIGGGQVRIPNGTYLITGTLTVADNVALVGAGSGMTILTTTSTTISPLVQMSGLYPQLRGIQITCSGTPSAGIMVTATLTGTFSFVIDDVHVLKCWNGFVFQGTSNAATMAIGYVTNVRVYNFQNIGMYFQYVNDIFVTNFLIYQKDVGFNVGAYGIYMTDKCEAVVFTTGDVVGGATSLNMTSATPGTHGQRPAYNSFQGVYFDSAANGSNVDASVETTFSDCWFSTGGLGGVTTASGLTLGTCDTMMFTNCRWHTNAQHGCTVNAGALRVGFVNCAFTDNSVLAASGVGDGLIIANSANGVEVIGGFARNGEYSGGRQGYGIAFGTTVTNLTIYGVDVNGNVTGGISAGTALSASVSVIDCKGFVSWTRSTGIIPNAGSSLAVAHGLTGTPFTVICTMLDTGGGAQAGGANIPRVLSVGTTNFTFDIGVVATANRPFSWEARL